VNERPRQYATAAAFRVALETRLKSVAAAEGIDLQRLRRQVSFDRLLARFFAEPNAPCGESSSNVSRQRNINVLGGASRPEA
jgi:hypothetical protein